MSNEKLIFDFFIGKGFTAEGTSGVMGNIFAESGFIPTNLQNSYEKSLGFTDATYTAAVDNGTYTNFVRDSAGYGLVQWTYWSRKEGLLKFAQARKVSIGDLQMQLDYIWVELEAGYKSLITLLKTTKSVTEASNQFMLQYERPGDQSAAAQAKRAGYSQTYFDKYGSTTITQPTTPTTPTPANPPKGDEPVSDIKEIGNGYTYEYQPATKNRYWNLPNQNTTGIVIHSIGCPQPRAQVLVNNFNKDGTSASVHGFVEPGLYIETAPTRVARNQAKKCYHVGSGSKGSWNNSRLGIEMCEPSTIKYTGGSNFQDLNPANTKKYIEDVTKTMVLIAADLCRFHGWDVSMISTHAEAYRLGYGGNHGDPDHIWRHIGYSIAQFRLDVQARLNELKGDYLSNMTKAEFEKILDEKFAEFEKKMAPTNYETIDDVPDWGKSAVQNLLDTGLMSGTGGTAANGKPKLNISGDLLRTIVLNDRAGIYKKTEATSAAKVETTAAGAKYDVPLSK